MTEERKKSITLRELRGVHLLLHRHFAGYVSAPRVRWLPLHKDNRAVVAILNAMVFASPPIMVELQKLMVLMNILGVKIEVK